MLFFSSKYHRQKKPLTPVALPAANGKTTKLTHPTNPLMKNDQMIIYQNTSTLVG